MKPLAEIAGPSGWRCARCGEALRMMPVDLAYMKSNFTVDLPCCPKCGLALVPEDLASGKMAQVEMALEDK